MIYDYRRKRRIKMVEERKIIPYKLAKGNRPTIDEVIENCVYGEIV